MRIDPVYARDRAFWQNLLSLGLPIALQNLISSSLNLIDNLLVGQLGESAIGGLALANQFTFLVILFTYGICSGAAIFASQYWGAGKLEGLRSTQGLSLMVSVIPATVFSLVALLWPRECMSLYTKNPVVLDQAVAYLRISAFTFPVLAGSFAFSMILRCIGQVRIPLRWSLIALGLNVALSLVLIFGWLGFPAMGVAGAAAGTLAARMLECCGILLEARLRRCPNLARPAVLFRFQPGFARRFLHTSLPVLGNDMGWALGISTLVALYSGLGQASLAAVSIYDTASQFLNILIFGSVNATAITTGRLIGEGRLNRTRLLVRRSTRVGFVLGLALGLVLACLAPILPLAFNISAQARSLATGLLLVFAVLVPFRSLLYHQTVGLFRGAGDTRFPFLVETGGIWLLGVLPAIVVNALLQPPVWVLFAVAAGHEVVVSLWCLRRFRTGAWIKVLHHH